MKGSGELLISSLKRGPGEWRVDAACRDTNPQDWYPDGATGAYVEQIDDRKAICFRCPVRNECLEHALAVNEEHGIWGGRDENERRSIKRARAKLRSQQRQRETAGV